MAEIADLAAPDDPYARIKAEEAATAAYEAAPEDPYARIKMAEAKGVAIDTAAPVGGTGIISALGEFGRGVARGVTSAAPRTLGQMAQFFNAPEAAGQLEQYAKEQEAAHPQLRTSQIAQIEGARSPLSLQAGAASAGENIVTSEGPALAGMGVGAGVGALVGGPVGAGVGASLGYAAGALGALPLFYGSQAQQSKQAIKEGLIKQGMPEPEAEQRANLGGHLSGAVEAGLELVADIIPFHALFRPFAKAAAGELVKSTLSGVGTKIAKNVTGIVASEVGTEMAQQALEDQIEKDYGSQGPGATWRSTLSVVVPTAIMSLLPGAAIGVHTFRTNLEVKRALSDPDADPNQRLQAATLVADSIASAGRNAQERAQYEQVAEGFRQYAARQIIGERNDKGEFEAKPIELKDDPFYLAYTSAPTPEVAGINRNEGMLQPAAAVAIETGATAQAQAARSAEAEKAVAAETGQPTGQVAPVAAEAGPLEEAVARKTEIETQTGVKQMLTPSPTASQGFAVTPTAEVATPSREAASEAAKQAEIQRKETAQDLNRRMGAFKAEARDMATRAKDLAEGIGEPAVTPLQRALEFIANPYWNASGATRAMKVAGEAKRPDLAQAIADRAQKVADDIAKERTFLPKGTPQYEEVQRLIGERAQKAQALADKLGALIAPKPLLIQGAENADRQPSAAPVGAQPVGPQGPGRPGEGGGVGVANAEQTAGAGAETQGERGPGGGGQPTGAGTVAAPAQTAAVVRPSESVAGNPPDVEGPAPTAAGTVTPAERPFETAGGPASAAQIKAENFPKPRIVAAGFPIALETKEGQTRRSLPGVEPAWESKIRKADYGHFDMGQPAADSTDEKVQKVDVFVKPGTKPDHAGPVFVVDQLNQKTGQFDEHKVMLGYGSRMEAIAAYKANYPKGWKLGEVAQATNEEVRRWLDKGDLSKPFSGRATDPFDKAVRYDKLEEVDDKGEPTGRYASGKVSAREALADIEKRLEFTRLMQECLRS